MKRIVTVFLLLVSLVVWTGMANAGIGTSPSGPSCSRC